VCQSRVRIICVFIKHKNNVQYWNMKYKPYVET